MNTDDLYAQIERLFFENQQLRQERAAAFRQSDEYMAERDRARATAVAFEQQLAGKDLACPCPIPAFGEPDYCHAAWLIHEANKPEVARG